MAIFSAIASTFNYFMWAITTTAGSLVGGQILAAQAAAALLTGAVVYGVGKGVGKMLMPDFPTGTTGLNAGTRVQLSPNTGYRVPVVYGKAFQNGIITDAAISTDNQTMTYVLTFGEKTSGTTTLGDIFWNDKKLVFSSGTSQTVTSTIDEDGTTSTDYANNVEVFMWDDTTQLRGNGTDPYTHVSHWNSTERNSGTIFAIIKITFDPEAQLTGLGTITAELTNSLDNPAEVLQDYLTNTTYGCSIPLADVDTTSLTALSTYSDQTISYTNTSGASATQKRYTINGIVNTSEDCRTSIDRLLTACNSFFTFDAKQGKWKVSANKAESTGSAFQFNDNNIISDLKFSSTALDAGFNSVEVEFPDKDQKDKSNYVTIDLPSNLRETNEPDNQMTIRMEFVNNNVQASYLANQQLRQTRDDLVCIFTADYTTMGVDAGDIVKLLETEVYGQNDKLYRVLQTVEKEAEDGMITIEFTCLEYNADVYTVESITEFTPAPNSDIALFNRLGTPTTPTVDNERSLLSLPAFDVNTNTPASGIYTRAEVWSDTQSNMSTKKLLDTFRSPTTIGTGTEVEFTIKGLASGTYYYQTRVGNDEAFGPFSATSSAHNWTANVLINPVTIIDGNQPVLGVSGGNIIVNTGSIGTTFLDSGVNANLALAANAVSAPTYNYFTTTNAAAPSNAVFNTAVGRNPKENDIVVATKSGDATVQKAYIHNGTSFIENTNFFSGGLVTDGTIGADAIVANSISTGKLDFTPITTIAGQTGATITSAQLSSGGLRLTNDSVATSLLNGTVGEANGGTGRTTIASYVADLNAAGLRLESSVVGTAQGGTGETSTANYVSVLSAAGLRLTSSVVGEAQGGTGTTSFDAKLTAEGVGFISGSNQNLGDLAALDNITLAKVTNAGSLAALNSATLGTNTTGTLPETQGGTGQTSDSAFASHLGSQGLIVTEVAGGTGAVSAATIISAGSLLVADSNVTRDTNGGITQINGGIITTGTLDASTVNVTNINATNITSGQITADKINVTDLVLESDHNVVSGGTIGGYNNNQMRLKQVGAIGTEPGFYQGYVRIWGSSGQVKTASIVIGDGTFGGSGNQLRNDISYTNNSNSPTLPLSSTTSGGTSTGFAQYHSTASENWSSIARFQSTNSVAQLTVMFRKTSANTVPTNLYILAQGDGGLRFLENVEYSFHRLSEV